MPVHLWVSSDDQSYVFEDDNVFFDRGLLTLRRTDSSGDWSPTGTYKQGKVLLPDFAGFDITGYHGFEALIEFHIDKDKVALNSIDFNLSNDGGTTFFFWDGGAWAVAGATDFNTAAVISTNIATFPLKDNRSIRPRARLTPDTDGLLRPCLNHITAAFELTIDSIEDMKRSLKRKFDSIIEVFDLYQTILTATGSTVQLQTKYPTVTGVMEVYNLTDDSDRTTNLFLSIDSSNLITMTASQDSGDLISIRYKATVPVFLSADAYTNPTVLPAIWVEVTEIDEMFPIKFGAFLPEPKGLDDVRVRLNPIYHAHEVRLHCLAGYEMASVRVANAVLRFVQGWDKVFVSVGAGFDYTVLAVVPQREVDRVKDNLYDKIVTASIYGVQYDVQGTFTDHKKAVTINTFVGNAGQGFETISST